MWPGYEAKQCLVSEQNENKIIVSSTLIQNQLRYFYVISYGYYTAALMRLCRFPSFKITILLPELFIWARYAQI